MRSLRSASLGALAVACLSVGALLAPAMALGATPTELLPDLRIARPSRTGDIKLCGAVDEGDTWQYQRCTPVGTGGERLLRFDSVVYNAGQGPLRIVASRPDMATRTMTGIQRIRRTDGSWASHEGGAYLEYAEKQDGHPHWHTHGFETYRLFRLAEALPDGAKVGHKIGYCFFDGVVVRPDLPRFQERVRYQFGDCGTKRSLAVKVGLSVGWGDTYPADFAGQYIDITDGVPDGRYLLCLTADPLHQFREADERDNDAWARIRLKGDRVIVIAVGQSGCQEQLPYPIDRVMSGTEQGVDATSTSITVVAVSFTGAAPRARAALTCTVDTHRTLGA